MGIIKNGKVVIVLAGRFAGRKAIVVKASEEGNDSKKFGHALVAGIDRYPRKVVRAMGKAKVEKRTKIKPFVKVINFNHMMPTRYSCDIELKKVVDETSIDEANICATRKSVKKIFEEKYRNQSAKQDRKSAGASYFFTKLRF
eukprot:CAMPEP_0181326744 /NCGR_PEP_ID=MMETSP1101-20121128/21684_1 /TAXON_ID=46948 /ORGANISM="Rhodomonas abbreviata, Strain Caron Lab Isolate" /LENGTH=142 /DNA_ID=CAMNT_0023435263 /DNA_START=24 /DNA_END=452 /DNA_ORIENTATION=+